MDSTKATIMAMLKAARGGYVSSKAICETLQTSRTAVWKHIHALQKQGYQVEAVTNKGYRLAGAADFVTPDEINERLRTRVLGRQIVYHESVDSTNRAARTLADRGAEEGTLVIAEEQTHGRGRFNRKWFSPANSGVWMSLILRPDFSIAEAARMTMLAAVAVAQALTELANRQAYIKWPNDILFDGKKISGILTEVSAEGNLVNYCIVGIGINVNVAAAALPADLQPSVCSLHELVDKPFQRADVVAGVLLAFEALYGTYQSNGDFAGILGYVRRNSATLGKYVEVETGSAKISGLAEDIDGNGALLVRSSDHRVNKLFSGDILIAR